MTARQAFRLGFVVLAIMMAGFLQAQVLNNEVEFSGTVSSAVANGEGGGTLFVQIEKFDLRVIVNAKTTLLDSNDTKITFDDIKTGVPVVISGKFSSSGVLATKVLVLSKVESPNTFEVSGHITSMESTRISLLGLTIETKNATVQDGATLSVGTWVYVTGEISADGLWTAKTIRVVEPGKRKARLTFEGTVKTYDKDNGLLTVLVAGTTNNVTTVHITSDTEIKGELKEGAYVSVTGRLVNFDVEATEIEVIGALEIKPDEKKLKVGETAEFTIKLREPAPAGGLSVSLAVNPNNVITLSSTTMTITAGERTGTFTVTAGSTPGSATITATALASTATALVVVGTVSEDEGERPSGEVRIAFAPSHIKMGTNETREVVLLVQPPQSGTITFGATGDAGVKALENTRSLGNGVASMKVTIQSGGPNTAGKSGTVTATLGAAVAELVVDVEAKTPGKKN